METPQKEYVKTLLAKGSFMNQLEQKLEQDFVIVFSQNDLLETVILGRNRSGMVRKPCFWGETVR